MMNKIDLDISVEMAGSIAFIQGLLRKLLHTDIAKDILTEEERKLYIAVLGRESDMYASIYQTVAEAVQQTEQ